MMLPSRGPGRRAVVGAVGAVALAGAMFVGSAAAASAEPPMPPPPAPPNCSPADWAGVRAGVAAATSTYLFTHPPVNDFFATLAGESRDEMRPGLLGRQPAGSGRPRGHQATRSRLPGPL